jgi:hypothetical protein
MRMKSFKDIEFGDVMLIINKEMRKLRENVSS